MVEHFGVKIANRKYAAKLVREEFALINTKPSLPFFKELLEKGAYADEEGTAYKEEWCKEYREICLKNYDLNMRYFSLLDKDEFERELELFIKRHNGFEEIFDLNACDGEEGYYIMVLDAYKQTYIGKAYDIKKRIRKHWSNTLPFDRTLFPMYAYENSVFSIDFFRALDTTRIFAWKTKVQYGAESDLVADFPTKFCANRIGGDVTDLLTALATKTERAL